MQDEYPETQNHPYIPYPPQLLIGGNEGDHLPKQCTLTLTLTLKLTLTLNQVEHSYLALISVFELSCRCNYLGP